MKTEILKIIPWQFFLKKICKFSTWIKSWKIWAKIIHFKKAYRENFLIYKYTSNKYTKSLLGDKNEIINKVTFKTWIYADDGYTIIVFEIDGEKYYAKFIRWKFLLPFNIYKKNSIIRSFLLEYVKMCRYYRDPISNFPYKREVINDMLMKFKRIHTK